MLGFLSCFFTMLAAMCSAAMCWLTLEKFTFISRNVAYSYIFMPLIVCGVAGFTFACVFFFRKRARRRAASVQNEAGVREAAGIPAETMTAVLKRWKLGLAVFWFFALAAAVAALYVVHINSVTIRTKQADLLRVENYTAMFRSMEG